MKYEHFTYPVVTGRTDREKLENMIAFLRQLIDRLNFILDNEVKE